MSSSGGGEELSPEAQIEQLERARKLVEEDSSHCSAVVSGILQIAKRPEERLRKWSSSFLVDAFTVIEISEDEKKELAVTCLSAVSSFLQDDNRVILKNAITCAGSIYPYVFLSVIEDQGQVEVWEQLQEVKRRCLELWNSDDHFGIQATCIKFVQQVVRVQLYGTRDPRLADNSDISLSLVPAAHQLIDPTVEAEAHGLLDRLLQVFKEEKIFAPKITCALNAVIPIMRSRPSTVNTILRAVLNFDTSAKRTERGSSDMRSELEFRFVDKAMKILLGHLLKQNVFPKHSGQIQKYLSTISQGRASEKLRKRLAQSEDDTAKRVKLEKSTSPVNSSTSMPSGPASYTSLFSLISPDDPLISFDAKELPPEIAVNIALAGIATANQELVNNSINIVESRYQSLLEQAPQMPNTAEYPMDSYGDENDDSDYEPMEVGKKEAEENAASEEDDDDNERELLPASAFSLPEPNKLSEDEKNREVGRIVERLISYSSMSTSVLSSGAESANKGINRVAVTEWNKDTWIAIVSRLLTRGVCSETGMDDVIRSHIYKYVMGDFRDRIEIIVSWLNEEWYSEFVKSNEKPKDAENSVYYKWAGKILDQLIPLMEVEDSKSFLRLLSDLPELNKPLVYKIRSLCIDPYRAQIGYKSLKFLIMLRPPVKEDCLDLLEDLYKNSDKDSGSNAAVILKRYRPQVLEETEGDNNND